MKKETNSKKIQESIINNSKIKAILFGENDNNSITKCNSKENANRKDGYGYGFFAE